MGAFQSITERPYRLVDWRAGVFPPHQWDVADALDDGWSRDDVLAFMRAAVSDTLGEWPDDEPEPPATTPEPPAGPAPEPPTPAKQLSPLDDLVRHWCFLSGRGKFRNVETGAEMRVDAFNLTFQALVPEVDFTVAGRMLKTPKAVPAADYVVGYAHGSVVQDTLYLPQFPSRIVEVGGIEYLNAYLPHLVPAAAAEWAGHWAVEAWRSHLQTLFPDDWRLLLLWIAKNVQQPGHKILWAPIIKGTQGDGKSSISDMMGAVMGAENVRVVSTESLFSDFTGYAEGACVAFLEEIRVKGHNRHDAMNKLKPLVTNKVVEVVRKGENGRNIPNVTNYMAFTNFEDALVIDANDRRWGVFFTRFKDREDLAAAGIGKEYWDKLHTAYGLHADVLRAWLLEIDTSGFDPMAAPPLTAAKTEMIKKSLSADAAAIKELIELGRSGIGRHVVATDCLNTALKAEGQQTLATSRCSVAFDELGWRRIEKAVKWNGQPRRVYVDGALGWPEGEEELRQAIKAQLDETEARARVGEIDMAPDAAPTAW